MGDYRIALQTTPVQLPDVQDQMNAFQLARARLAARNQDAADMETRRFLSGYQQPANGQSVQTAQFGQLPSGLLGTPEGRAVYKQLADFQNKSDELTKTNLDNAKEVNALYAKSLTGANTYEDVLNHYQLMINDPILSKIPGHADRVNREIAQLNAAQEAGRFNDYNRELRLGAEKASAQHFGQMDLGDKIVQTAAPEYVLPGTLPEVTQINSERISKSPNAPNTVVNVTTGAGAKEAEKGFGQELPKEFNAMQALKDTVAIRQKALKLLDKASPYMGTGGTVKLAAAKGLRLAGEDYDKEGVEAAEQISGIATLLAGPLLKASDPSPSQKQMERMEKAIGNLSLEPGTFRNQITDSINRDLGKIQSYNDRYNQAVANGLKDLSVNKIELPNPNALVKLKVLGVNGKAASEIPRTIKKGDWIKVIKNGSYHKLVYDGTGDPGNLTNYSEKQ